VTSSSETEKRQIETETLEWQGVTITVSYDAQWCRVGKGKPSFAPAHLVLNVVAPRGALLPVTDTGYRSHFLEAGIVEEAGGPAAYVRAWLDQAAKTPAWHKREAAARQLDLFR
jgi:hypothetical protein